MAVASLVLQASCLANDSAAELSVGGLRFMHSADVTMESEDLRIALDSVSIRYQFRNGSGKPVTLTVAFPLPDIELSEPDSIMLPAADSVNFVEFQTKVDGKPAKFTMDQRAMLGDKDVSGLLNQLKFPLLPIGAREVRIPDLPPATRDRLVAGGLLTPAGQSDNGKPIYGFAWVVKTSAVRQQTFPADKPVEVEHRYKPSVGVATDTILRKPLRLNKDLATEIAQARRDFCISDGFLAGVDKLAANPQGTKTPLQERRISYVLNTGANWAGPIKTFKLSIDPGADDRLVSVCAPGLKATPSKRPLEFTATDFKPETGLKILIVGRF